MIITSLSNNKIKGICKLKEKKYRDSSNTFLIEGEHLVEEAYKNILLKEIIVLEGYSYNYEVDTIYVNDSVMKKISSMDSIPSIIGICKKKDNNVIGSSILILDGIQDPGNLGTIIRSSVAFNIDTIVLSTNTVDLYNSKVIRSTQGMIFSTNIIVKDIYNFIKELKDNNYIIYGTKVDSGIDIRDINIPSKYALVIGNEGNGISEDISNLCDSHLYIKMNDKVESLNAGVATSILLYEINNKRDNNEIN